MTTDNLTDFHSMEYNYIYEGIGFISQQWNPTLIHLCNQTSMFYNHIIFRFNYIFCNIVLYCVYIYVCVCLWLINYLKQKSVLGMWLKTVTYLVDIFTFSLQICFVTFQTNSKYVWCFFCLFYVGQRLCFDFNKAITSENKTSALDVVSGLAHSYFN